MAKRGFVERVRSDTDSRATDAVLTDLGWKTLKAAAPGHVAGLRRLIFADLEERQQDHLADMLSAVYIDDHPRRHTAPARLVGRGSSVRSARRRRRRTSPNRS
jgi:hypothetical protein